MAYLRREFPGPYTDAVTDTAGADELLEYTIVEAPPPEVIPPPVAVDDTAAVTVNGQVDIPVLANDAGEGAVITAVSAVSGDGGTVEIVGSAVRFFAPSGAGESSFTYTIRTGTTGVAPDGGTDTATVTVTINAEPQQGTGTLTLTFADPATINGRIATAPQFTAPAGHFLYIEGSGFGVADHMVDVLYEIDWGDPTSIYTRNDEDDLPWDPVWDVDGTWYFVRGDEVYNCNTGALHATPGVQDGGRWRPNHGTVRTYLGTWANRSFWPRAAHVYHAPGTYTVTVTATKRGELPVTATKQIIVKDPEVVFTPANTFLVTKTGSYAGAPGGVPTGNRFTSYSAAMTACNTSSSGKTRRILFEAGQEHSGAGAADWNTNYAVFHVNTYGSGAGTTRLTGKGIKSSAASGEYTWANIDIRPSGYRQTLPFTTVPNGDISKSGKHWLTVTRCTIDRCKAGISWSPDSFHTILSDVRIADWAKYGSFGGRGYGVIAYLGYIAKGDNDTIIGPGEDEKAAPYFVDHGPQRNAGPGGPLVFDCCDLRSIGNGGPGSGPTAGLFQPNLRIGRSRAGSPALLIEETMVARTRGAHGKLFGTGNSDAAGHPRRYFWDMCYAVMQNEGGRVFSPSVSGLVFRNCVAIISNTKANSNGLRFTHWLQRDDASGPGGGDSTLISQFGVDLYNSTLIDMRTGTSMAWDTDRMENGETTAHYVYRAYSHVKVGNLVVHCPNKVDATETGDGPLADDGLWSYGFPGVRYEAATPIDTDFAIPDGTACWWAPESGSAAIGDASTSDSAVNGQGARVAVCDFLGRLRGTTTARGAFDGPL